MLLSAFVLVTCGLFGAEAVKCGRCDCFIDETRTNTVNCSRRDLDYIPADDDWEGGLDLFQPEYNVMLRLSGNNIRTVSGLPSVRAGKVALKLKSNQIESIEDDAFQNVSRIVYLDLSHNRLSGQELRSEIFRGTYKQGVYGKIDLKTLNVSYNLVHSLDLRLFEYTPDLKRLYLNNNPFEILDQVTVLAISSAVNLEVLDLSYIKIDSIPVDTFRGLTKLQQLDLSGNNFMSLPESLAVLGPSLQYLTFNNNPIEELNDDSFLGLTNLKELEVSENARLEEVRRSTFSPLRRLRVLHLCHNKNLRYISHNAFRNLKEDWTLKELYLDSNDLSELPTDLLPWSRLDVISLTGNDWRCNCDLANIVIEQKAGEKFVRGDIPTCISPMRLSGTYITQIPLDTCPDHHKMPSQNNFFVLKIKHKYILWSIVGVSCVIVLGTCIGLLKNFLTKVLRKCPDNESIRYVNIDSSRMV